MESDNVSAVSRMYSRAMPFPWNWIGPYKLKEDATARVDHLKRQGPTEYTHEVRQGLRKLFRTWRVWPHVEAGRWHRVGRPQAYMLANKIYGHLSTKLGKHPYFFGPK